MKTMRIQFRDVFWEKSQRSGNPSKLNSTLFLETNMILIGKFFQILFCKMFFN